MSPAGSWEAMPPVEAEENLSQSVNQKQEEKESQTEINDGFVLVSGGTFLMGSPESEAWRGDDEQQHTVTVSDFYMSPYDVGRILRTFKIKKNVEVTDNGKIII